MKYSYITLLTNDNYFQGVVLLNETLRKVKSKYPLICMITEDISQDIKSLLVKLGVIVKEIDKVVINNNLIEHNKSIDESQATVWENVYSKFRMFDFEEYDKLIFLDADLLILKNIDDYFEKPSGTAAEDGEYFNLWPKDLHFNSGFFIFKPDKNITQDLINFINTVNPKEFLSYKGEEIIIGDQDVLNVYFKDWEQNKELHLDKYNNVFTPYITYDNEDDILSNSYFLHYVGVKPWQALNDKEMIYTTKGVNNSSFLAYELGHAVISYVYINGIRNID